MGKESTCNAEDVREARDSSSIPGSGRSPGGDHGSPLQCSCLENPMDRGAWRVTLHRSGHRVRLHIPQSWTQLKRLSMHTHYPFAIKIISTVTCPAQSFPALGANSQPREGLQFAFLLCSRMGFLAGRQAQLCWERTSRKFQDVPTKRTALGLLTLRRGPTDT